MLCVCSVGWLSPTLCDPMDCSPPDSSVHGIFPRKKTWVGYHFLLQEANIQPPINVFFSTYCFFNYRNHFAYWKKLFYHKTNVLLNWISLINWIFRKKYLSFGFKYFCSSQVFLKKYFVKHHFTISLEKVEWIENCNLLITSGFIRFLKDIHPRNISILK